MLDTLVYMRDVEGFTSRYLDGFAGHPSTLGDPLVARFLEVWQAEEGAHAEAIDRFLRAYCDARDLPFPRIQAAPPVRTGRLERWAVTASRPVGHVVTATHMAWGATNELLTLNGYRLLAARCGHPMLAELLSRIAAQEARHYGFYHLQTEFRLAHSPLARRIVPALMARTWTPVGIGDGFKQPSEFDRVLTFLASDAAAEARIDAMDEVVRRLPGCGRLSLYRDAVEESRRRLPEPSESPVAEGRRLVTAGR